MKRTHEKFLYQNWGLIWKFGNVHVVKIEKLIR